MDVAPVVVENEEADRLREGLRGSVIEQDLQSLFQLDGIDMLTGTALAADCLDALRFAGLSADLLSAIESWSADRISVSFQDARTV
ncbi:hypothetical protein ACFQ3K_01475 [Brucella gallinifaecis]|uniref:Uncharacterized protein n=1 Tax=Brucella gallinifaecis TaxID=215590 RepID=A0A502BKB7_9HYPH|nr:hypothetical protein [Brucella gallinifaecis]TPF73918.1 hypothetical protein FHY56_17285 [Brucella gallinifaecis]